MLRVVLSFFVRFYEAKRATSSGLEVSASPVASFLVYLHRAERAAVERRSAPVFPDAPENQ